MVNGSGESSGVNDKSNIRENGVEYKFVTIAGKEVEVKYETVKKSVDIFGLRGNGYRKRNVRPYQPKPYRSEPKETMQKVDSNISLSSFGSDEQSKSDSSTVKSNKLSRMIQRYETESESHNNPHEKAASIETKIKEKIKKEPIKVHNRFVALPSTNEEVMTDEIIRQHQDYYDYHHQEFDTRKKRRRKKTQKSMTQIETEPDDYDDGEGTHENIAQLADGDGQCMVNDQYQHTPTVTSPPTQIIVNEPKLHIQKDNHKKKTAEKQSAIIKSTTTSVPSARTSVRAPQTRITLYMRWFMMILLVMSLTSFAVILLMNRFCDCKCGTERHHSGHSKDF